MPAKLTTEQSAKFHQQLKERFYALREELRQEMLASDDQQFIDLAGQVNDLEERSVADLLVDLNLANIDRHVEEIRDIDAALIRIAEGNYGVCTDCDAAIPPARLQAHLIAKRCLECQTIHEKSPLEPATPSI